MSGEKLTETQKVKEKEKAQTAQDSAGSRETHRHKRLVIEDSRRGPERFRGNFRLGDFFGDVSCRYGHTVRLFNIGRCHYVTCDSCRTYIFVGANLMSSWRYENEDIWQKNFESKKGYKFLE